MRISTKRLLPLFALLLAGAQATAGLLLNAAGVRVNAPLVYFSTFSSTENPISESSQWVNGLADALDWHNVQTASGHAYGTANNNPPPHDDSVAHLKSSLGFGNDYAIETTIYVAPGYTPPSFQEVEHFLRADGTAHNWRGYEVTISLTEEMIHVMEWNGAVNDFNPTPLASWSYSPLTGDVVKSTIVGSAISVYVNGVLKGTTTDSTWSTGNPGVGFWARPGCTPSSYALDDMRVTKL